MNTERAPLTAVPGLSRTAQLPPPPPRRVQPAAATLAPADPFVDDTPSARTAESTRSRTKPSPRPAASSTAETMRNVTLSLPASLVTRVKDRARADRVSQPEVLMDALIATQGQFEQLLAAATAPPLSDGLFLRRPPPPAAADPMATLSLRLLSPNLAAIDDLVAKHEAPSRSALCATALRAYLDQPVQS